MLVSPSSPVFSAMNSSRTIPVIPGMLGKRAGRRSLPGGASPCQPLHTTVKPRRIRELIRLGHEVRLMPARYVKPYVQHGRSDALDAEAICEAVSRPTMRFATIKTTEQQSVLTLHRSREILVKQETMLAN